MMTNSYRYYLEATEPVVVGAQRYHTGDFILTPRGRPRCFATLERAISWKHKNIGLVDFPVKPVMHQVFLPKLRRR